MQQLRTLHVGQVLHRRLTWASRKMWTISFNYASDSCVLRVLLIVGISLCVCVKNPLLFPPGCEANITCCGSVGESAAGYLSFVTNGVFMSLVSGLPRLTTFTCMPYMQFPRMSPFMSMTYLWGSTDGRHHSMHGTAFSRSSPAAASGQPRASHSGVSSMRGE